MIDSRASRTATLPVTAAPTTPIGITRLAGNIGAEISGVDLGGPVAGEVVSQIRQALLEHKVVFLRDQKLTYEARVAFAQRLGDLTLSHPIYPQPNEKPYLREMDSKQGARANHWHTDLTFIERPPAIALLYAVVIPPTGGDTTWANGVTAYQSLPVELRELADKLRIVHSNDCDFTEATVADRLGYIATVFETEHPAVRVHPETGERALLLGGFARRVVGFDPSASRKIIDALQEYAIRPEHTVRWRWRVGDLVVWDNRSTQHYAIYDYGPEHRRGERLTVTGDRPVGVDGRQSVVVRGDASTYADAGRD
jgi:taurine dioxygenase